MAAELRQRFRTIEAIYAALPEQRGEIERALLSPRPAELMAAELQEAGFTISPSTIRTYRRARRAKETPSHD